MVNNNKAQVRENLSTRERLRRKLDARNIEKKTEVKLNEISDELIRRYTFAKEEFEDISITNPITILKDKEKYISEYNKYILTVIEAAKEKGYGLSKIHLLLDNSYTRYMTKILELPPIPEWFRRAIETSN